MGQVWALTAGYCKSSSVRLKRCSSARSPKSRSSSSSPSSSSSSSVSLDDVSNDDVDSVGSDGSNAGSVSMQYSVEICHIHVVKKSTQSHSICLIFKSNSVHVPSCIQFFLGGGGGDSLSIEIKLITTLSRAKLSENDELHL